MDKIRWGIIGCGDVTEVKSGPAFNKVENSELVAIMRRNAEKAKYYAERHKVPKWYDKAEDLINDPDINAIYVATPPSSHEQYAIASMKAGKPVYLEKPMTVNSSSAKAIAKATEDTNQKLSVAHYRREQPLFKTIRQLVRDKAIGETRLARLSLYKPPLTNKDLEVEKTAWRVDPLLAGGGLFHDLSPHQLDLMYYFFGDVEKASGISSSQSSMYHADDIVSGYLLFKSGVHFTGTWCFNVSPGDERDECEIIGEKGKISFSFFDHKPVRLTIDGDTRELTFEPLQHVQQPMIAAVVNYFLGRGANPCTAHDGVTVMSMIDSFSGKNG